MNLKSTIPGLLAIVAASGRCNARSLPSHAGSVRLDVVSGRPFVEGVFVNGQGPYRFLLDTGAQTNLLEPSIVRKLGIAPTVQVAMATVSGTTWVAGGSVAEVSVGSVIARNQDFLFAPLGVVHTISSDVQGILGEQFLARFDYLLDYTNQRLIFLPVGGTAPEGGSRVSIVNIDGCPAIETSEGKLTLDSGASSAVLFRTAISARTRSIRTVSGSTPVSAVPGLRLRVAGREYHLERAVSTPRPAWGEDGDGLLPTSMFHAVFVSNSGQYAILDPAT